MTRIIEDTLQCFVCGAKSQQRQLASTHEHGSPDLDGRPAEEARSTMPEWVQTCPRCGYCAPELSRGHESSRALVRSPAYQAQLRAQDSPLLANRFLCAAMACDAAGRDVDAAHHRLHAAWVADDEGRPELARQYRSAVADALLARREALRAWRAGDGDWKGAEVTFLVDVLRRAGRFQEALRELENALQKGVSSIVREILRFERSAIERGDAGGHRLAEALSGSVLREDPRDDDPLLGYLLSHCGDFVTPQENKAAFTGTLRTPEGERWATDDPQVLTLLAHGKKAFTAALEKRLLADHPDKVVINRCPKCGGIARTPKARQCRFCHHSWHDKR
ncbi:hypothetical protein [Hyalangium gracile]|uniref:hypothetical protein n=1 Tax=Hyalangium gracile TaxID=394092 RepID=UPI001CCE179F|nr:hypothetical protein [Hyalangium gracile]